MLMNAPEYLSIIENIKSEIKAAQYRATVHANSDMLLLYHDIGCVINEHKAGGNKFVDNLSNQGYSACFSGKQGIFRSQSEVHGKIR